ncbi:MAG TPA: G/U mismatch-specific DNA glycosylase [Acidimicrobiales bacterium]|nr:G/U mismatch-specific DNA glycosylase [Acidimicrobiales bacterium]
MATDAKGGWPSRPTRPAVPAKRRRPTAAELEAARDRRVPDIVANDLDVLFCGINPGLWSGALGHHFAHPGNRFWKVLHGAGFTPTVVDPAEDRRLLEFGLGITNLVPRVTARASELGTDELRAGGRSLARKVRRLSPRAVAFVGIGAYRIALKRPRAQVGEQPEAMGSSAVWALPNPSGLQAYYQMEDLVAAYAELRRSLRPD